jgi:VIT1/CCC1 family predicted Fe2+/Mn2+ transporter
VAALDPTEKKRLIERLSSIREIVFGMQDGILTTAGVLAGLSGAVSVHRQVILAALASTAAGALSMGAGAYLGTRAQTEVLTSELERTRQETAAEPYVLQEGLLHQLEREGLSREASYRIVQLLSSAPQALLSTAEVKLYGLSRQALGSAAADGVTMGVAFLTGAAAAVHSDCVRRAGRLLGAHRRDGDDGAGAVRGRLLPGMVGAAWTAMAFGPALSGDRDGRGGGRLPHRLGDRAAGRCRARAMKPARSRGRPPAGDVTDIDGYSLPLSLGFHTPAPKTEGILGNVTET